MKNLLVTFPAHCFAWRCRRKFCRTSQGLKDLYYSGANLSLMRALLFSLERTQMSPKNWVFTAVSQGKHWFQICPQHPRTFIFVGGWVNTIIWCVVVLRREKGGKKKCGGDRLNVWMDNRLSAWVIRIFNCPCPTWLDSFSSSSQHNSCF